MLISIKRSNKNYLRSYKMNKKIIGLSILSALAFTANVHAANAGSSYTEIGVASISVEVPNQFKAEDYTFFSLGGGYNITDNVAIQVTGYLPMSAETQGTINDTYRERLEGTTGFEDADFGEVQSTAYNSTFESKGMITADLKLTIPLHERFSAFAKIGYTYASFKATGYNFVDNAPVGTILPTSDLCDITGVESNCEAQNLGANEATRDESGFSYGAGFALHLANNSSFVFSYNQYLDKDDLNAKGFQANYQWKF
jgi:opacity protein-like surface antigen